MRKIILLISFLTLVSCRKVEQGPLPQKVGNLQSFIKKPSPFVKDESLDLFLTNPWYVYDEANHIIWPNFQIYSLKTEEAYYKVQVIDYYDSNSVPGYYSLRVQEEGRVVFLWDFEAAGCGNVYTNLNYKECLKDPVKNIYTYLNFKELKTWKMTSAEATLRSDWDMAFNGTEVKINAGNQGKGQTRIGDLYLYRDFFPGGVADFQEIAEVSFSDKGKRFFDLNLDLRNVAFALPPGVDRVVDEGSWFMERRGTYIAKSENWWILKGGEGNTFSQFHVLDIKESFEGEKISTNIVLEFFYKGPNQGHFEEESRIWELPTFDSTQRLIKWCLDFDSQSIVDCSNTSWDLLFSVSNRRGKRRWRFNVNQGAIGPIAGPDREREF